MIPKKSSPELADWLNAHWEDGVTVNSHIVSPAVKTYPVARICATKRGKIALHVVVTRSGGNRRLLTVALGQPVKVATLKS